LLYTLYIVLACTPIALRYRWSVAFTIIHEFVTRRPLCSYCGWFYQHVSHWRVRRKGVY
jgi:hypothetical protein